MTRRRALAGGILLLLGLVAMAAWDLARAPLELRAARSSFEDGVDALRDSDLSLAREHLGTGRDHAAAAAASLGRPWVTPLQSLPVLGDDLAVTEALATAAVRTADAADAMLLVASDIVHEEGQQAERGVVPLPYLRRIQGPLATLADVLDEEVATLEARGCHGLVSPVERACRRFLEIAAPRVQQVRIGADLAAVAPSILGGGDRPRRYLVFAAAYSELRGSVGLLGSWAVMTAADGVLEIGPFRPSEDLPPLPDDVDAPTEAFGDRYARYGALREWRNTNMSADFPTVGALLVDAWNASGRRPVDGVFVTSPVSVEQMIELMGPMEVPGVATLTSANARRFIGLDAYEEFGKDDARRKRVLGAVAAAGFERMLDVVESNDVVDSVEVLQHLVERGDLVVYLEDPRAQGALERAGAAGALPGSSGDVSAVIVNNVAGNKVDYFTSRAVAHVVTLHPDGVTESRLDVTFHNAAPTDGYPRGVLGPWTPHTRVGDNLSLVTLLCSATCTLDAPTGSVRRAGQDAGLRAHDVVVVVPSGQERRIVYRTRTPDGWHQDGVDLVLDVRHVVQPTIGGSAYRLEIRIPDGWRPVDLSEGLEVHDGRVVLAGAQRKDVDVTVRLRRVED